MVQDYGPVSHLSDIVNFCLDEHLANKEFSVLRILQTEEMSADHQKKSDGLVQTLDRLYSSNIGSSTLRRWLKNNESYEIKSKILPVGRGRITEIHGLTDGFKDRFSSIFPAYESLESLQASPETKALKKIYSKNLDELDLAILLCYSVNSKMTVKELGQIFTFPYSSTYRRINKQCRLGKLRKQEGKKIKKRGRDPSIFTLSDEWFYLAKEIGIIQS